MNKILVFLIAFIVLLPLANADSDSSVGSFCNSGPNCINGQIAVAPIGRAAAKDQAGKDHADAQFDRRLPPVIPGERISDGERTVKVWTTVGPVPVAPAGSVDLNRNNNNQTNSYGIPPNVIIDRRQN